MAKGEASTAKVHFKGNEDDFVVFVDDVEDFKKWQTDKSVPLANFVSSFKVFVTHRHGAQGTLDGASNAVMDNEFGTHVDEDVIKQILEKGTLQESEFAERQGRKNDANGPYIVA
ncbi:hypothetical protein MAPG_09682 [Magnaporthiopsis poae ATCC 64411]|uniref:Ribosome maturation protein SDO1/SBDS N-terminal domain-containing protein n=1 Tax=Magnaporthiopsis poae (strain ATCC 64411 / 73-15) TaxID=644358 RepID=A0A0C4EAK7_MAGP6|nr:hypothetical protein MAPG_09682 [Magnaporthiopsis poae ATCC 64411]